MLPETGNAAKSPLEEVSFDRLKGKTYPREFTLLIDTSRTDILPNNPNRLAWQMINEGADDVRVSTDPTVSQVSGWLLVKSGGVISMIYYDDGEAVGYAVYGVTTVANNRIRVREILRS